MHSKSAKIFIWLPEAGLVAVDYYSTAGCPYYSFFGEGIEEY